MDLEFPRGDTKVFKFKITDKNGEKLNLTSTDKLYMTVKKDVNSNTVIFQKRIGNGIEFKDDGYYYVTILPSDTSELSYGQYGYDIEIKTGTGIVKTLVVGTITLTEEYTFKGDEI